MRAKSVALVALPTLSNAVSLSDMAPRAMNLPQACNAIYTAQIGGCNAADFQTRHCSQSCISALVALVDPIKKACGNQGVSGENLIVAFLANVGPEQICPNYTPTSGMSSAPTSTPSTMTKPSIIHSPTTAHKPTETSSLLVDTSSTMTQTEIPKTHHTMQSSSTKTQSHKFKGTTTASSAAAETTKTSLIVDTSSHSTQTQAPAQSSGPAQNNFHDHSGGGSPFDTPGNEGGASTLSLSATLTLLSAAAAFFMFR